MPKIKNKKKNILIIADRPLWAYHLILLFVKENFKNQYNIYSDYLAFNMKKELDYYSLNTYKHLLKNYINKLIYRNYKKNINYDLVIFLAFYLKDQFINKINARRTVLGIYTEGYPPQGTKDTIKTIEEFKNHYLLHCDGLVCGSSSIKEFYSKVFEPCIFANSSHSPSMFKRKDKIKNNSSKFIIGWTGNPKRGFKHYYDIIEPAVQEAKRLRPGIEFKTRFNGPFRTLPNFYNDVDIVLIASDADAGPSLFIESAYMNIPAISTYIGWPSYVIRNYKNGIIVEKNSIKEFVKNIILLYDNRELLFQMASKIREDAIKKLGPEIQKEGWQKLFDHLLPN